MSERSENSEQIENETNSWTKEEAQNYSGKYLLIYTPIGVICMTLPICCNVVELNNGELTQESKKIHSNADLREFLSRKQMQAALRFDQLWWPYVSWPHGPTPVTRPLQ